MLQQQTQSPGWRVLNRDVIKYIAMTAMLLNHIANIFLVPGTLWYEVLVDIGYGLCDKPEDADLILFNTCAVREHAEQRVFGNVGALKGLKEKKRGLMIGLCGCMANQKHVVEKLRKSYPYVDLVFGVDGIDTLPQLIAQKLQKHKRVLMEPAQRPVIVENIPIRRESEFRAWLPIMYGCDNFCTY